MKEIALKQWRVEEAKRLGISEAGVKDRIAGGKYPDMPKRYLNKRIAMVPADYRSGNPDLPKPNEITLKEWTVAEAGRLGVSKRAVEARRERGSYPRLKLRRINSRVVYVKV